MFAGVPSLLVLVDVDGLLVLVDVSLELVVESLVGLVAAPSPVAVEPSVVAVVVGAGGGGCVSSSVGPAPMPSAARVAGPSAVRP